MDFHTLRFILLAAVLYGLFHLAYHELPDKVLRSEIYPTVIGEPAKKTIEFITPDRKVRINENRILSSKAALNIVRGCDGSGVLFMLVAAVISFSLSSESFSRLLKSLLRLAAQRSNAAAQELKEALPATGTTLYQMLVGLILGVLVVYIINQVRIVGLFYLVEYDRTLFPVVHTYYAPTLIVFLIAAFFLWWTRWTFAQEQAETPTSQGQGHVILSTAIKAFVAWALLSVAGQLWGERMIQSMLPYYEFVVEQASDDFHPEMRIEYDKLRHDTNIVIAATSLRDLPITPDRHLPAGRTIEASSTVKHALVPLVILATICLVFPVTHFRQRLALLALFIPALLFVSALTAPMQLLGNLEIGFVNAARAEGYLRESLILDWVLLTEGGARWLIPLLTGIGCGAAVRRLVKA